jgi:ribosomal protein S18 acetylase RimI-like enzyme
MLLERAFSFSAWIVEVFLRDIVVEKGKVEPVRIRNYRQEDLPTLIHIEQLAREADGREVLREAEFVSWLTDPSVDAFANVFVITDDDDDLNTWGQAGTLEGIEGEIVGYTVVSELRVPQCYQLCCQGTVHPQFRRQHAGRALLICALNRARMIASEFEFEAEHDDLPIYFEALLPDRDSTAASLAAKCGMELVDSAVAPGLCLYRGELYR